MPKNYNLTFEPDLKKFTFYGKEIITFELKSHFSRLSRDSRGREKEIVLDAVDLQIVNCELLIVNRNIISSHKIAHKEEKLYIYLSQELKPGEYKLSIEFQGVLNDKLAGFYRSRYIVDGKQKVLATTQFEAADARRAFPCIDNPSYKATFDVSMIVDKNLTAISNTLPINVETSRRDVSTKKIVRFERTPLMSTHLLYLGVGEFEFLEDVYTSEVFSNSSFTSEVKKLRIVTTAGKSQYGKFALDCAKKFLKFYEEYFDYPYPLKKLDFIAIPDFASGAMENWGAITFRENALLFYPEKSSKATMQRIAEVVAHEIAHQWFGNLVTMKWWDDLWLNESFATYMAYKGMDKYWPEWKVWDQYTTDTVFEAMALDGLRSSHPIKVAVKHISEIDELFDEIAYDKGGSILRMLNLFVGDEVFKDGLRSYIKKHQYKNTQATDLWNSLGRISDKPILNLMQRYITQVGFPAVKIDLKNDIIRLEQSRFLFERVNFNPKQTWTIPYHLGSTWDRDGMQLLEEEVRENKVKGKINYLNINKNYSSFFISEYSKELLKNLGKNISNLNNSDKLGIIHDLFALILAGKKDLQELYRYIDTFFRDENSNIVLHYVILKLVSIFLLTKNNRSKLLASKFSERALSNIVGFEPTKDEQVLDTYLRSTALSTLSLFDDEKVKQFLSKKFIDFLKDEKSLHPDLRAVVFSSAVWSNESNHRIIKNLYRTSLVQEEKAKFLMALGNSKSKKLIQGTLEYALSKDVPFAFIPYAVNSITRNPYGQEIVLDWLILTWRELVRRSGGLANMLLRRILQAVVPLSGIGRENAIENFLKKNKVAGLERTAEQVLEELRINSRFTSKYGK